MSRARLVFVFLSAAMASLLLQREFHRGTFDPCERAFVGWLSANSGPMGALPPLTLVLYDEEASELAGATRMGTLDIALFTRAASKLGAAAAGVEGLAGDPSRMMEAAGRLPVFAGYAPESPPGMGWTPWSGVPQRRWTELPGVAGSAATRLPRGFFAVPESEAGPRRAVILGRNADAVIPSFLALAWRAAQGERSAVPLAEGGWLRCADRSLPVDAEGATCFFPSAPGGTISMNELLVAAEKHERGEGASPLSGRIVVLARATADIARVKNYASGAAATPSELWAQAWAALRQGRSFVLPGWWYQFVLVVAAAALSVFVARRGWLAVFGAGFAGLLVYLLTALGVFASAGILLPFVPTVGTLLVALLSGCLILRR